MMQREVRYGVLKSPIGEIVVTATDEGLTSIRLPTRHESPALDPTWRRDDAAVRQALEQLRGYFAGELTTFDLPLAPRGTEFQRRVWNALRSIPYGETTTCGALAARLGAPTASRAVGAANGRNPWAIVVPCHRVIGTGGALTGYACGVEVKRWLLEHEAAHTGLLAASSR